MNAHAIECYIAFAVCAAGMALIAIAGHRARLVGGAMKPQARRWAANDPRHILRVGLYYKAACKAHPRIDSRQHWNNAAPRNLLPRAQLRERMGFGWLFVFAICGGALLIAVAQMVDLFFFATLP